jgi:hypothetical protein
LLTRRRATRRRRRRKRTRTRKRTRRRKRTRKRTRTRKGKRKRKRKRGSLQLVHHRRSVQLVRSTKPQVSPAAVWFLARLLQLAWPKISWP